MPTKKGKKKRALQPAPRPENRKDATVGRGAAPTGSARKDTSDAAARAERRDNNGNGGPLVVGIGASAGGLEAFQNFLDAMAPDSGMAFVIVQHLDPSRKSLSAELLGRHTSMRLIEIEDGAVVEPDTVFVMPPDRTVEYHGGTLRLAQKPRRPAVTMPVDILFRSLADALGPKAVGIVFSGTGTDGTLGLKAIKAAGGMTLAQQPDTAKFDGMPRSAIAAGTVDHVLRIERMPEVLGNYARHPYVQSEETGEDLGRKSANDLNAILALLRARTPHDFRCYKTSTLARRTQRRMGLLHIDRFDQYVDHLRHHPEEIKALVQDLLISVTDFFREPEAWADLGSSVLRPLVEEHNPDDPIRVWTPGCATGEEPYSVAMLILEQAARLQKNVTLQVFATDVDEQALAYARNAEYPASIAGDLSAERLARFFVELREDHRYRVAKPVRESVIFARQDLITDPPFSKLNLITCRNLLIYLRPEIQDKLIALLHFALREDGVLFLGNAETIGRHTDLFQPISKKWRVFRRIGHTRHDKIDFPVGHRLTTKESGTAEEEIAPPSEAQLIRVAQRVLADRYAPASVVVNNRFEALYFSGPIDDYLSQPSGPPTRDLLVMVREGLRARLRTTVQKAIADDRPTSASARLTHGNGARQVRITVSPIHDRRIRDLYLVTFETPASAAAPSETVPAENDEEPLVTQLEEELTITREDLQSTIEQLETSNEELKTSNEEVMSMNEELQSSNEELETSKEELQSLNEELTTVNNQLQSKVEELERANNDLDNLLNASDVPTICLDRQFRIMWFTPATSRLVNLIKTDIGRPIEDFAQRFTDHELLRDARSVLRNLIPVNREVRTADDRWMIRRVLPYRTSDDHIDGVVITLTNVTDLKQAQQAISEARDYAVSVVDTVRHPLVVLDSKMRGNSANQSFYDLFDETPDALKGQFIYELGNGQLDAPELRRLLGEILPQQNIVRDYECEQEFPQSGRRTMLINARRLARGTDRPGMILFALEDITERKQAETLQRDRAEQQQRYAEELEQRVAERTGMLQVLRDVAAAANEADDIDDALRFVLRRVCEHDGWCFGHAYLPDANDDNLLVPVRVCYEQVPGRFGAFREATIQHPPRRGEGLAGRAFATGEPQWAADVARELFDARARAGDQVGIACGAAFPILAGKEIVGVLEFFSDRRIEPADRLLASMGSIGTHLGRVIERQRFEREVSDALLAEQHRIGADLHDTVSQELAGLALLADQAADHLRGDRPSEADAVQEVAAGLRRSLASLREAVRGILPPIGVNEPFRDILEELIASLQERHRISVSLRADTGVVISDANAALHLYRIASEAMSNAVRHARASQIVVHLTEEDQSLIVRVRDNGIGMPQGDTTRGSGLRIMRHRAKMIGARLDIRSTRQEGTEVSCIVPTARLRTSDTESA